MIENGLILTGSDAELLRRAPEEVKSKTFDESQITLNGIEALNALVAYFRRREVKNG